MLRQPSGAALRPQPQVHHQRPSLQGQPVPGPIQPTLRPAQQHAPQQLPSLPSRQQPPTPPNAVGAAQRLQPQLACATPLLAANQPLLSGQGPATRMHSVHGPRPSALQPSQRPPQVFPYLLQQQQPGGLHLAQPALPRVPRGGQQLVQQQQGPGDAQQSLQPGLQQHPLSTQAIDTRNKYRDPSTALAIEQQKQQALLQRQAAQQQVLAAQESAGHAQPGEADTRNKYRRKNPKEWPPIQRKAVTPPRYCMLQPFSHSQPNILVATICIARSNTLIVFDWFQ